MKKTSHKKEEDIILYPKKRLNKTENSKYYTKNKKYKDNINIGRKSNKHKEHKFNISNMDANSKNFLEINDINNYQEFDNDKYNNILKDKTFKRIKFLNYKNKKSKKTKNDKKNNDYHKRLNLAKILIFFLIFIIIAFIIFTVFRIYYNVSNNKFNIVIPIRETDFNKIAKNTKFFMKFIIGLKNIVFIGDEKIESLIKEKKTKYEEPIIFINEKKLIDIDKIKNLINNRKRKAYERAGWYIQQFLKMEYYKICKDKYYLIWDGDTVPIRNINMLNDKKQPYFDLKEEYHEPYFNTMKKLIPDLRKQQKYSFISEHMLVKTEIMKDLINRINNNKKIDGENWYEKVINSINIDDLEGSGFSEYETYGTFTMKYYSKVYELRYFNSLRDSSLNLMKYNFNSLSFNMIQNISKNYYAITFEK